MSAGYSQFGLHKAGDYTQSASFKQVMQNHVRSGQQAGNVTEHPMSNQVTIFTSYNKHK